LPAFLALFLFGLYMLLFDGTLHSTDGLSMFAVAENLIKHGHVDTRQLENWENVKLGIDGQPYSKGVLITFCLLSLFLQILGIFARDYVYLGAAEYWGRRYTFSSYIGELSWNNPEQWPIWGHLLRFNPRYLPVIWHWELNSHQNDLI
jgi:hypothetical protein